MWLNSELKFGVRLVTSDKELFTFKLMKRDYPSETADYVFKNKVGRATARKSKNRYVSWATDFQRGMKQVIRRVIRLSTQPMHEYKRESTKELIIGENLKVRRARSCSEALDSVPRKTKNQDEQDVL